MSQCDGRLSGVYLFSALVQLVKLSWRQDRYELAKSAQQPQQVATPSCACKSVRLEAPAATVSFIWRSVMALHRQTYMVFPLWVWFVFANEDDNRFHYCYQVGYCYGEYGKNSCLDKNKADW